MPAGAGTLRADRRRGRGGFPRGGENVAAVAGARTARARPLPWVASEGRGESVQKKNLSTVAF